MEKEYDILKVVFPFSIWSERKLLITQDTFSYYKSDKNTDITTNHISELQDSFIVKDEDSDDLILSLVIPNDTIKITNRDNPEILSEIRDLLTIIKRNYGIIIIDFYFQSQLKGGGEYNTKELKLNMSQYTSKEIVQQIQNEFNKNDALINEKINAFIEYCNRYKIKINKPFDNIAFNNDETEEDNLMTFNVDDIDKVSLYYTTLMQMLVLIRRNQINCRFKRELLINETRRNYQLTKGLIQPNDEENEDNDQELAPEQLSSINTIEAENPSISLKAKLIAENKLLRENLHQSLDKYTKKKEKLKRFLISTNIKTYHCYNCGNLLQLTESTTPTCEYDSSCTSISLFFCLKCDIHFCTYCIIYQRNSKCSDNHRLFPSTELNLCLLCDNSDSKTYFSCEHCNVAVCSKCMGERQTKEMTCRNCNIELTWRKEVYAQCNNCQCLKDCFWGCSNCEYSLCLKCVSVTKGFCGAAHKLNEFNMERSWFDYSIGKQEMFSSNVHVKFMGKCMKCDDIIEGKGYCCLRCSFFICYKCSV